jgi:hypothetical protein
MGETIAELIARLRAAACIQARRDVRQRVQVGIDHLEGLLHLVVLPADVEHEIERAEQLLLLCASMRTN